MDTSRINYQPLFGEMRRAAEIKPISAPAHLLNTAYGLQQLGKHIHKKHTLLRSDLTNNFLYLSNKKNAEINVNV